MQTGMLVAGLAFLPIRAGFTHCARESLCLTFMLIGINLGGLINNTPAMMLAGMIVGMVCGLRLAILSLNFYDARLTR